jgi:glycerol-3-phosphate acyltransferase PlsY
MQMLLAASVVLLAYVFGSIPFGLIVVKLTSGKDIRQVASGRTGGTNAARAAGVGAGLLTALMDGAKGAAAVWVSQALAPANEWLHVLAPIAAILGHNYSIFLAERDASNRLRLRGGAGGGPTVGGALGLWWPSALIVLPLGTLVFFGIGYASVTTMSAALIITAIFAVRYGMGLATLPDVLYGVIAFLLLVWALRPNIKALIEGRERFHGWRPWRGPGLGRRAGEESQAKLSRSSIAVSRTAAKKKTAAKKAAASKG